MRINKFNIVFLFISMWLFQACAQKKSVVKPMPNAENIIDYSQFYTIKTNKKYGKIKALNKTYDAKTMFEFETKEQPDFIYKLATAIPLKKRNLKKGQVFLLRFDAKTLSSGFETGEAKILWQFRQNKKHQNNLTTTISIGSDWQTYYVPLKATTDIDAENLKLIAQFGFRPQKFLIKNIKFLAYPEGTNESQLPKTKITYIGMDAEADWRQKALKRIDSLRKTDFSLQFMHNGQLLKNIPVQIKLIKHDFNFGAAIGAKDVVNNTLSYKKLKEYFNTTVLENDIKIRQWQNPKKRAITLQALDVLKNDNIKVKGHVLIWPGFRYLPKKIKANQENPELIKKIMLNHVKGILRQTKGKIAYWDVVNETYTNKDLQRITGSEEILYEGFKLCKKIQPEALRFTNEYGIISKGGIDRRKQEWYYNFVKRIDENTGGLVDGIGIQSHIGSDLTPPEKVLEILDYYADLNKQISISEFTMDLKDPEIREKYTRDFMIAVFSHPKVSQFLFWGLVENNKGKVDIFKTDGTPGAMGRAYLDLTQNLWKTEINKKTDKEGKINAKGFYGTYQYKIKLNGKEYQGVFNIVKPSKKLIKIIL